MKKSLIVKKICEHCANEFETNKQHRTCCSISCAAKERWKKQEFKDKMKVSFNSDERRKKISKSLKHRWKNPISRKKLIDSLSTEEYKKKAFAARSNNWKNPEYRKNKIEQLNKTWEDPLKRKKQSDFQKIHQNKPEVKLLMSKIQKEKQGSPETNKKRSNTLKEKWNNDEYAEKCLYGSLRYKKFTMPSGKIVKLQGYEPKALAELLKNYQEDDIVIGVKEINKSVGKIIYMSVDGKHRYIPDFYIKSINTIIEVKSEFTYNINKIHNELKRQACLDLGFNFNFIIL
jgi:hypothetical protein